MRSSPGPRQTGARRIHESVGSHATDQPGCRSAYFFSAFFSSQLRDSERLSERPKIILGAAYFFRITLGSAAVGSESFFTQSQPANGDTLSVPTKSLRNGT